QRGVLLREDAHVAPGRDRAGQDREARDALERTHGEDVVEKIRGEASGGEVLVWVDVVVVRHGDESVCSLGGAKRIVRDRAGESPDLAAPEVGERTEPARVGGAHGEHFAKL